MLFFDLLKRNYSQHQNGANHLLVNALGNPTDSNG